MRLQVAIDRVTVEQAEEIVRVVQPFADILEVGTSLIKDYGLAGSVGYLKNRFPEQKFLADIKTCDEGGYEFRKCYEAGADLATVMGFSSNATIDACREMAVSYQREYMIDMMETGEARVGELRERYPDAVFGVHLPSDCHGNGLDRLVAEMCGRFPAGSKISVAGGVKLSSIPVLKENGVDIVIVGSAITKADNPGKAAEEFAEKINKASC